MSESPATAILLDDGILAVRSTGKCLAQGKLVGATRQTRVDVTSSHDVKTKSRDVSVPERLAVDGAQAAPDMTRTGCRRRRGVALGFLAALAGSTAVSGPL